MRVRGRWPTGVIMWAVLACGPVAVLAGAPQPTTEHPLLEIMEGELKLSMDELVSPEGTKPYFIQYAVTDQSSLTISASLGALMSDDDNRSRLLDADVRCGDYALDSTRQIRGGGGWSDHAERGGTVALPLNGDPLATRHALWLTTDAKFKDAVKRLSQVQANLKVMVEEEDPSEDFSHEEPSVDISPWIEIPEVDRDLMREKVRRFSLAFRDHPLIYSSGVYFSGTVTNELAVNSEGSKLQHGRTWWRIGISASTIAEDGMRLEQAESFDARTIAGLPDDETIMKAVQKVIDDVLALREAAVVEPYTGPAILIGRASGVFFHEIFGHRIEGHRQKNVDEGQTFAKKVGQEILPTFLSIVDDPSIEKFNGLDLNGYYKYDDECVPGQPVTIVDQGVLKTFLMSRSPTRGFTKSNGHGRRQPGRQVVARQGNLIIKSTNQVPYDELRALLIAECKKQEKEFGLLFKNISGGLTMTRRYGPQAFNVNPLEVYRVYADGRPDELVRGVDIVGTPLTSFSKILCTGDDPDVFNGTCGAESGRVPVSAVSPSILVEQIEVEKRRKEQNRPPILDAPIAAEKKEQAADAKTP